ncbi:MAG: PorV/PorQ family protein [Fibrobacter sp.]|jgi:ligand-binding sensor domain-containing protein|nr:PorV/PorQ family protein [Fibrobacter sp.]
MISTLRKAAFIRASLLLTLISVSVSLAAVGESAVITLIFPPGARATGMGEAFTGLADDASATYYNPAGLGQAPLAHSWKTHSFKSDELVTAIASKKKKDFGFKDNIWAGTNKGLLHFNGKHWESYELYLIQTDDDLEDIASKFLTDDDEKQLREAIWVIRAENGIEMKRYADIKELLKKALMNHNAVSPDSTAKTMARQIVDLSSFERTTGKITEIISKPFPLAISDSLVKSDSSEVSDSTKQSLSGSFDSLTISSSAEKISDILKTEDLTIGDLTEIRIPFSIAVNEAVKAMILDNSERVWIGTASGLWRYNKEEWKYFSVKDGLPSNNITSLALSSRGDIAVGTDKGLAVLSATGNWKSYDTTSGLPLFKINAVQYDKSNNIYVGTNDGLYKIGDSAITVFDTTQGLLSNRINALMMDSDNKLWIGGENGICIYDETTWKRYKFPNSIVTSISEEKSGSVWIGTNKGVVSYKARKPKTDDKGNVIERAPQWNSFHSKNSLKGDSVTSINIHDNDIWIGTDKILNQYDKANMQSYIAFEQILPELVSDLWHLYLGQIFPTQDWGTVGLSINYLFMGENEIYDALGNRARKVKSWEGVFNLSYGFPITKKDLSLGLNAKYVVSALAPGGPSGEGVGHTFALDAAVLKRNFFLKGFDLGFMFQNMGPHIFYIHRDNVDPIPFTLRLGMAYRAVQTPIHDLKFVLDLHKEIVKNYFYGKPDPFWKALVTDLVTDSADTWQQELQEININLGMEYWYNNVIAVRSGLLFDYIGERYELNLGLGLKYSTLKFDFSYIVSPKGFMKGMLRKINSHKDGATGVRDGQWRVSFLFDY